MSKQAGSSTPSAVGVHNDNVSHVHGMGVGLKGELDEAQVQDGNQRNQRCRYEHW